MQDFVHQQYIEYYWISFPWEVQWSKERMVGLCVSRDFRILFEAWMTMFPTIFSELLEAIKWRSNKIPRVMYKKPEKNPICSQSSRKTIPWLYMYKQPDVLNLDDPHWKPQIGPFALNDRSLLPWTQGPQKRLFKKAAVYQKRREYMF